MADYAFVTRWSFRAPIDQVWTLISEPEHWPEWWPACSISTTCAKQRTAPWSLVKFGCLKNQVENQASSCVANPEPL